MRIKPSALSLLTVVGLTLFVANGRETIAQTSNFRWCDSWDEGADIPGLTYGQNELGRRVIWVGNYLSSGTGAITEIDVVTGEIVRERNPPVGGWGPTGPGGLAFDLRGFLWVASYNDSRIYQVDIRTWTIVSHFPSPSGRLLGGLAFDGLYVWVTNRSHVYQMSTSGNVINSYDINVSAGLESANGLLFLVRGDTAEVEVRDLSFNLIDSYSFPPCSGKIGDLAIDPSTGTGYWGARSRSHLLALHLIDIGPPSSWSNYGSGWPGTNGVPNIVASGPPLLGDPLTVSIENSSGQYLPGVILFGIDSANVGTQRGGTILVSPWMTLSLSFPVFGLNLHGTVPCDPELKGLTLYAQALQVDPGASHGVSFTPGLELVFGE